MKKKVLLLSAAVLAGMAFGTVPAAAETEAQKPIYADQLVEGTYSITVDSSSSMFRIVDAQLTVADGAMEVCMTLSGTGYEKLFMGTGEEALASPDEECIYFVENGEGMYTYTVPIEALDQETDCAAWSIRKQSWYDRVLVFESAELPEEAYAQVSSGLSPVVIGSVVVLIVLIGGVLVWRGKSRKA